MNQAAYECVHTLFSNNAVPSSILTSLFAPLNSALGDDAEIRQLTLLTLSKAVDVRSSTVYPYLPNFLEHFRKIVDAKPKENAVKQEIERMEESKRGVVRLGLEATKKYPQGLGGDWMEWWSRVRNENQALVKAVESEMGGDV
jgi:cullin-associated NEDD8-dissociated protein 1